MSERRQNTFQSFWKSTAYTFQRTGRVLRSSPKCGRKGFRPAAVLESGLKGLEELEGLEKLNGNEELAELEELKGFEQLNGLEKDTDLIDKEVLQRQNDTSEDEDSTKSSQAVQVGICIYLSPSYFFHSA